MAFARAQWSDTALDYWSCRAGRRCQKRSLRDQKWQANFLLCESERSEVKRL